MPTLSDRCRNLLAALTLVGAVGLAGCGGPSGGGARDEPPAAGPHGGATVTLPEKAGFGEVVIEPAAGKRGQAVVAAFFYGPDGKTPLSPPPTSVAIKLALPGGDSAQLTLEPDGKAGASEPPRFASKPGPYQLDTISGEMTVDRSGQPVTIPFSGGR